MCVCFGMRSVLQNPPRPGRLPHCVHINTPFYTNTPDALQSMYHMRPDFPLLLFSQAVSVPLHSLHFSFIYFSQKDVFFRTSISGENFRKSYKKSTVPDKNRYGGFLCATCVFESSSSILPYAVNYLLYLSMCSLCGRRFLTSPMNCWNLPGLTELPTEGFCGLSFCLWWCAHCHEGTVWCGCGTFDGMCGDTFMPPFLFYLLLQ